jgi:hypothetical protein
MPPGGHTAYVSKTCGPTAPLGGLTSHITKAPSISVGGLNTPPCGPTTCVAETGSQSVPPCDSTTRVAKICGPTTTLTSLILTSAPHATPITLASTSTPHVKLTTTLASSLATPASPSVAQLVSHVLLAGAVPVSHVVYLHPMRTRGATDFWQPKIYIATTLSLSHPKISSDRPH